MGRAAAGRLGSEIGIEDRGALPGNSHPERSEGSRYTPIVNHLSINTSRWGGAFLYSRRGLRLWRRGAYGIHRASGPRCQGLCRKVASLRSGSRRLAVRTAKEHPIGALPRTPFPASRDFPSRGNEKIGGTGYCVTYDTDSQSRNADFISIARRAIRNSQRRSRCCPLSGSEHNPSTQPAAPAAPLF